MKPLFDLKFEEDEEKDSWFLRSEPLLENMQVNFARMLLDAEEEWWTDRVIEVLESKGYTVTKEAASEH